MYELYSRRIKNAAGEPEVYEYDVFPDTFRNQFFYVLSDVFDFFEHHGCPGLWDEFHDTFSRELGRKCLYGQRYYKRHQVEHFVTASTDEDFLDLMDYAGSVILQFKTIELEYVPSDKRNRIIDNAISELNLRLKQHNLGYELVNGEIIRKDSEYLHQEVVKPALKLLIDTGFLGAEQEFMDAFEHRRKRENKDAILDALKAFESTMKAICDGMGYQYDAAKSTAKDLISILEQNGFYPTYLNNHMTALRTSLESGLPTLRNKNAGHGQGAQVVSVSDEFTEYALNLAATNIVLLARIYKAKKAGSN